MTPTVNSCLPLVVGKFSSLSEALDYAAKGETGVNFYSQQGELELSLSYRSLRAKAIEAAARLMAKGISYGDRVAIIADTGLDFLSVFYGCQYIGAIACPMPFSLFLGGKDAYVEQLHRRIKAARASLILLPQNLLNCGQEAVKASSCLAMSFESLFSEPSPSPLSTYKTNDIAYVQYSSGSTSQPKGILITQDGVCANVQAILEYGMQLAENDRAFSWLPFYHDMGLVGFSIAAVFGQRSVDYISPSTFARRPSLWLELMSANQSTITYAPGFGYELAAKRYKPQHATPIDLSALKVAGIGGDMIRPRILQYFFETFSPYGFCYKAFSPSYGLAEATLAISVLASDKETRIDCVEKDEALYSIGKSLTFLEKNQNKPQQNFVGCGAPLPGCEVIITDSSQNPLGDGQIGHLMVRTKSLMAGYLDDEKATADILKDDGFMHTGDLAYRHNGQLYITGRSKELIITRGRNIWPQDIEWAVEKIPPLTPNCAAAISIEDEQGESSLVVLVQCVMNEKKEKEDLRVRLLEVISQTSGVSAQVVFIPPRSLPFTSSGKLARTEAKQRYINGTIGVDSLTIKTH